MAEEKKDTGSAKKKASGSAKKTGTGSAKKSTTGSTKKTSAGSSAKGETTSGKKKVKTEEFEATSDNLIDEIKKIVHEGNVRRIIVRAKDGRELLNFSLTVGIIGLIWAPLLLAIGGIVGLAKEFTVVIERRDD